MGKGICLYFPRQIQQTFSLENSTQGGPRHSKWKQEPREEEIPIQAMTALKISRKHRPQQHQPYGLPTWGQIKTLTNQVKNLISQQGMPQSPETLSLCSVGLRLPPPRTAQAGLTNLLTQPPFLFQVIKWTEKRPSLSANDSTHMPPPWNPHTLGRRES